MRYKISKITWLESELNAVTERMTLIAERAVSHGNLKLIVNDTLSNAGKMIRPLLLMLSAGDKGRWLNRDELLDAAAVIEMTHTASLIHDDIIDDASTRRNKPTPQSKYGKCAAVYAGDYILSCAMRYIMTKGYASTGAVIAESVGRMCDGELIQLSNSFNTEVSESKYIEAIVGKTASLFETACFLGSRLGGQNTITTEKMSEFGRCLGIMFQLRDDLLDWTSTQEKSGKPVNEDFGSGIYTLPAIYTFRNKKIGKELRALASSSESVTETAQAARVLAQKAGGIDYGYAVLEKYRNIALKCLSEMPRDEYIDTLETITYSLLEK